jgi:hypothetical protein
MTPIEAQDEMLAIFKTTWDDTGYTATYDDLPGQVPANAPWARVTIQHDTGGQSSLASADSLRIFTHSGTLTIQVFTPKGGGNTKGYQLAHQVLTAYSPKQGGGVWFRNQRLKETRGDEGFAQINVLVDFSYDEMR